LKAEHQNRRRQRRRIVALGDQLAARPVEVAAELRESAAGCEYLYEQFERLLVGLEGSRGLMRHEWEWGTWLFGRRLCDLYCDPLVVRWAIEHLATCDYSDGRRVDLERAHLIFDEYFPAAMGKNEVHAHLTSWMDILPSYEAGLAGMKSRVKAEMNRLQRERTRLLADE